VENRHRVVQLAPIAQLTADDEDEARRNLVTVEEGSGGSVDSGDESSPRRSPSNPGFPCNASSKSSKAPLSLQDVKIPLVTEQARQVRISFVRCYVDLFFVVITSQRLNQSSLIRKRKPEAVSGMFSTACFETR
jgi:hypothetical protein